MADLRPVIVRLYQEGKKVMEISRLLNIPHSTVSQAIRRFKETGSNEDRPRSGRPVTATTGENIQAIADKMCFCNEHEAGHLHSQSDSTRKLAIELGIGHTSVQRIVEQIFDLQQERNSQNKRFLDNLTNGCSVVEHSSPAIHIHPQLFPMYISPNHLRHFHRPRLNRSSIGNASNFLPVRLTVEKETKPDLKKEKQQLHVPATLEELSNFQGSMILIEYLEEHPPILSQPGMASKILNYLQFLEDGLKNRLDCEDSLEFGESTLVEGSPFLGSLPSGKRLQALENNMYRSPIFQHSPNPNDFLLIVNKNGISLRKFPFLFVAGQQFPLLQVPSPGSKLACDFVKNSLIAYMYRLFSTSKHNPRKLKSEDLRSTFPHYSESTIYKRLRPVADFIKPSGMRDADGNPPFNYWTLKPESEGVFLPSNEEICSLLTPEMCCAQYSMLVAEMRLTLAGYANDNFMILSRNEEDGGEDNVTMEDEVLNAPWNTTKTFIDAMKGICMLDDGVTADPTGCGQGFSYVRMSKRPIQAQKQPRRKIIGTESDLRKLTLPEAKELCRELGVKEEKLSKLSRWQIVSVIRSISTQAAKTDKDDANLNDVASKFARGNMKMNAHRIKIKRHCQKIFDSQNQFLSDPTQLESDVESEAEEIKNSENVDLDASKLDEEWEMEDIIIKTENEQDSLDYDIAALNKPFSKSFVNVKQETLDNKNLLDLNELRKTWNDTYKSRSNNTEEIMDRQSPFYLKTKEGHSPGVETGIKELKIVRMLKNSAGEEHAEVESISNPTLIEAYLSIRATRDDLFVKNYSQADMDYKNECRKARRRMQDKLRRKKRNQRNAELGITRSKKKKSVKPIKENLLKMNCSACKGNGHMRTNKNCPLYRHGRQPRAYSDEGSSHSELDEDEEEEEDDEDSPSSCDVKPTCQSLDYNIRLRSSGRLSAKRARFSPTPSDSSYLKKSRNRSAVPEENGDLLHCLKNENIAD